MIYDVARSTITLSSGRVLYANRGILGISPDLGVFEGYDGELGPSAFDIEHGGAQPLTPSERAEIADDAIGLWTCWKQSPETREAV